MNTIISFTTIDDEAIAKHETEHLAEYKKVYSIGGYVRKIEIIYNDKVEQIQYFKKEDEDIDEIFSSLGTNTVTVIITVPYKQYSIKTYHIYTNGAVTCIEKNLLEENKVICHQELDADGNIDIAFSVKYLYDSNGNKPGEEIMSFYYNADGSLKDISGVSFPFSEHNQILNASEIPVYFPDLLTKHPYYKDLRFLPEY